MLTLGSTLISAALLLSCSACGQAEKPVAASANSVAKDDRAFKIAEEQRLALEKVKHLEQDLQKAADQQKRAIEAATDAATEAATDGR